MFLSNIHDAQDGYKPAIVHGFDKIVFRIHQADLPTPEFSKFARLHYARYGRVRRSRHLCVLRIVAPDQELIKAISVLPWKIVEAEVCRNTLVQDVFEARRRHDQLDRSFIQSNNRYGLRIAVGRDGGHSSYTSPRRPGLRFGWYSDRLCKFTRLPCLHEE